MSQKFKYIKGSADDFTGAPDWAVFKASVKGRHEDEDYAYVSANDDKYKFRGEEYHFKFIGFPWGNEVKIIAQREPIEERLGNGLDLCCDGTDSSHPECLKLNEPVEKMQYRTDIDLRELIKNAKLTSGLITSARRHQLGINEPAIIFTHSDIATLVQENMNKVCGKPYEVKDDEVYFEDALIDSIESTLSVRGESYGVFADGAAIMRDLKSVMSATDGWEKLTPSQQEALDMIQHKIGRILNGKPDYDDSWRDIAGYATLIFNELTGEGVK